MADDLKVHRGRLRLFHWIEDWPLKTRTIDWYRSIIRNDESYADQVQVMEKFFSNPIDMFPFKAGLDQPARFFRIQEEEIAGRFPGNRGYVGDADIRDLFKTFADIFQRNILLFVVAKKLLLIGFVSLLIGVFFNNDFLNERICRVPILGDEPCRGGWLDYGLPLAGAFGAIAVLVVIFRMLNGYLAERYRELLRASANAVSKSALGRTQSLYNLFGELMHQIDEEKMSLKDGDRRNWPREAGRWMVMAYWVSQRLEYIERYVQIQMWRIRRAHFFVNRGGLAATWLIALGSVVAIGLAIWLNRDDLAHTHQLKWPILGLVVLVIGYLNHASYATESWRTPLGLVRDTLKTDLWASYGSLKMHERLGRQVHNDKQNLVEADDFKRGH